MEYCYLCLIDHIGFYIQYDYVDDRAHHEQLFLK